MARITNVNLPALVEMGLTLNEYIVADAISKDAFDMPRQELADEIGLSRRSVINLVNRLEEKGFVRRDGQSVFTTPKWDEILSKHS